MEIVLLHRGSLFVFSAGVKFRVLEQKAGKPLRLLMQVNHRLLSAHSYVLCYRIASRTVPRILTPLERVLIALSRWNSMEKHLQSFSGVLGYRGGGKYI